MAVNLPLHMRCYGEDGVWCMTSRQLEIATTFSAYLRWVYWWSLLFPLGPSTYQWVLISYHWPLDLFHGAYLATLLSCSNTPLHRCYLRQRAPHRHPIHHYFHHQLRYHRRRSRSRRMMHLLHHLDNHLLLHHRRRRRRRLFFLLLLHFYRGTKERWKRQTCRQFRSLITVERIIVLFFIFCIRVRRFIIWRPMPRE